MIEYAVSWVSWIAVVVRLKREKQISRDRQAASAFKPEKSPTYAKPRN